MGMGVPGRWGRSEDTAGPSGGSRTGNGVDVLTTLDRRMGHVGLVAERLTMGNDDFDADWKYRGKTWRFIRSESRA